IGRRRQSLARLRRITCRQSWHTATVLALSAVGITPYCCCLRDLGCALAKSLFSSSATLTGEPLPSMFAVRGITRVIRTAVSKRKMSADDTVRNYKSLSTVERAFRSIKSIDLKVRPIHHRRENRVRAHILLCMLAYYVEWHMREAWAELLFAD